MSPERNEVVSRRKEHKRRCRLEKASEEHLPDLSIKTGFVLMNMNESEGAAAEKEDR